MADYNYTIYIESSALDSVLVPRNSSSQVEGLAYISTMTPDYRISAFEMHTLEVSSNGAGSCTFAIEPISGSTIPLEFTYDGATGVTTPSALWFSITAFNMTPHGVTDTTNVVVTISSFGLGLSAGAPSGTMIDGTSISNTYTVTALGGTAISNFTVTPRHLALALTWTNPTDIDLSAIRINYSTTEVPDTTAAGTFLYADSGTSTSLSALSANEYYYFRAWSIDTTSNTSTVSGFGVPFFNPWYPGTLPGETPTQTCNRYCEEAII